MSARRVVLDEAKLAAHVRLRGLRAVSQATGIAQSALLGVAPEAAEVTGPGACPTHRRRAAWRCGRCEDAKGDTRSPLCRHCSAEDRRAAYARARALRDQGYSVIEIAGELGRSRKWVRMALGIAR